MKRLVANALLCVLEYWFDSCLTCVRWGNAISNFIALECGVRQGGVLSPYLFAIFIDDIIKEIFKKSELGCKLKHENVGIFIYADDIILIAPTVKSLQGMLQICERALALLDVSLNIRRNLCVCDLVLAIIQNSAIYVLPMVIAYREWNRVVIWEFICVPQDILNARLVMLRNLFIDLSIQYLVN